MEGLELLDWLIKYAGALEDQIATMREEGVVDPRILDLIEQQDNPKVKGQLFGAIKRNPQMTMEEALELFQSLTEEKQKTLTPQIQAIMDEFLDGMDGDTRFNTWAIRELKRKQHAGEDMSDVYSHSDVLDYLSHFYREHVDPEAGYQIRYKENLYDLLTLTWEQLHQLWEEWQADWQAAKLKATETGDEAPLNIVYGPQWNNELFNGYFIVELKTKREMEIEGARMNHCAGSHGADIENGTSRAFSIRTPENKPIITIETDPALMRFIQVFGYHNAQPSSDQMSMVNEWKLSLHSIEELQQADPVQSAGFVDASIPEHQPLIQQLWEKVRTLPDNGQNSFFRDMVKNEPTSVHQSLAQNEYLPAELYFDLEKTGEAGTIYNLARNAAVPDAVFNTIVEHFLRDEEELPRQVGMALASSRKIAQDPDDPETIKVIKKVVKKGGRGAFASALNNPSIPSRLTRPLMLEAGMDASMAALDEGQGVDPKYISDLIRAFKGHDRYEILLRNVISKNNIKAEDVEFIAREVGVEVPLVEDPELRAKVSLALIERTDDVEEWAMNIEDEDVQKLMTRHKREGVRISLSSNENISEEIIRILMNDPSGEVRSNLAAHANLTPEIMNEMSKDPDDLVRRNIAKYHFGDLKPERMMELAKDKSRYVREEVAKKSYDELAATLWNDPASNVRFQVAHRIKDPEVLARMANDRELVVRIELARNKATPADVIKHYAETQLKEVDLTRAVPDAMGYALAANPKTPRKALVEMSKWEDERTNQYLVRNPKTPANALHYLSKGRGFPWAFVDHLVKHKNITPKILGRVWNNLKRKEGNELSQIVVNQKNVASSIAQNPKTPQKTLRDMLDISVRAKNKGINSSLYHLVGLLAGNESAGPLLWEVVKEFAVEGKTAAARHLPIIAGNPSAPPKLLEGLFKMELPNDPFTKHNVLEGLAVNPNTPEEILIKILELEDKWTINMHMAKNPNLTWKVAKVLLNKSKERGAEKLSGEERVLIATIAENPRCPPELIKEMMGRLGMNNLNDQALFKKLKKTLEHKMENVPDPGEIDYWPFVPSEQRKAASITLGQLFGIPVRRKHAL